MQVKIRFVKPEDAAQFSETNPPCQKARLRTHVAIQQFPLTGNPDLDAGIRQTWQSTGYGHREKDNVLYRDMRVRSWFIDWQSTGPLRQLTDQFGHVVLRRTVENPEFWEIVIGAAVTD